MQFPKLRKLPILKLPKTVRVDIGCGDKKQEGYIGIDIVDCGQDIVWDVRDGIPLPDNSVDLLWTSHFIEHLSDEESEDFLIEVYRVLKPEGKTIHCLPHQSDPTAYYFDHKTFWNEQRVSTLTGVPGLEKFKLIGNQMNEDMLNQKRSRKELVFMLQK
jgi:predicted SAM-dependent methyltransferase